MTNYTFQEHKHRYALWTAARAVNRDFCSTAALQEMDKTLEFAKKIVNINADNFEEWFYEICKAVLNHFSQNSSPIERNKFKNPSFGRAAKFVSIYLKTYYILDSSENPKLREIIYPPIDRKLLSGLIKFLKRKKEDKSTIDYFRKINWTEINEDDYKELKMKLENLQLEFNWTLERFWEA